MSLQSDDIQIAVADQTFRESEISNSWDLLKSIVFGGLTESIASLGVVSSAAGVGASTCKFQIQNPYLNSMYLNDVFSSITDMRCHIIVIF